MANFQERLEDLEAMVRADPIDGLAAAAAAEVARRLENLEQKIANLSGGALPVARLDAIEARYGMLDVIESELWSDDIEGRSRLANLERGSRETVGRLDKLDRFPKRLEYLDLTRIPETEEKINAASERIDKLEKDSSVDDLDTLIRVKLTMRIEALEERGRFSSGVSGRLDAIEKVIAMPSATASGMRHAERDGSKRIEVLEQRCDSLNGSMERLADKAIALGAGARLENLERALVGFVPEGNTLGLNVRDRLDRMEEDIAYDRDGFREVIGRISARVEALEDASPDVHIDDGCEPHTPAQVVEQARRNLQHASRRPDHMGLRYAEETNFGKTLAPGETWKQFEPNVFPAEEGLTEREVFINWFEGRGPRPDALRPLLRSAANEWDNPTMQGALDRAVAATGDDRVSIVEWAERQSARRPTISSLQAIEELVKNRWTFDAPRKPIDPSRKAAKSVVTDLHTETEIGACPPPPLDDNGSWELRLGEGIWRWLPGRADDEAKEEQKEKP